MFSSFILSNYIWEVDLEGKEKFSLTFLCPKTILNMKKPHIKDILTCAYVLKQNFFRPTWKLDSDHNLKEIIFF